MLPGMGRYFLKTDAGTLKISPGIFKTQGFGYFHKVKSGLYMVQPGLLHIDSTFFL